MNKTIARFNQPLLHPREESESHYVGVHIPLARIGFLREPNRLAYHTLKAVKQYDPAGGWNHRLTAWRFVIAFMHGIQSEESDKDETALSEAMLALVKRDIPHCLRDLRRCPVVEQVVMEPPNPNSSCAKYLFEYDRFADTSHEEAADWVNKLITAIQDWASQDSRGLRSIKVNWTDGESEAAAQAEPGQLYTGKLISTNKVAYIEFTFDSEHWGEQFFGRAGRAEMLLDTRFEVADGYLVQETIEFDRR